MYLKYSPYLSSILHNTKTIPNKWFNDIKNVEFDELLSSSDGKTLKKMNLQKSPQECYHQVIFMEILWEQLHQLQLLDIHIQKLKIMKVSENLNGQL